MTALIALETLDLDTLIIIDDRAIGIDGSSVYLEKGEILTAESLLYALMLRSANDAAEALAYEIAGSTEAFCFLMNEKAKSLDLHNTHFSNPHGLDANEHYTTAHDLAIISSTALKNPVFLKIVSTKTKDIESNIKVRTLVNHNKLLRLYDGCVGVKTGYTKKSGRSLVGAAIKNDLMLISVTLDAPNDWNDHKKLLDYGYSTLQKTTLLDKSEFEYQIPVLNGDKERLKITNSSEVKIIHEYGSQKIDKDISLPQYLVAPVSKGDIVGKIIYKINGNTVGSADLVADDSVKYQKKSWLNLFNKHSEEAWKKSDFKNSFQTADLCQEGPRNKKSLTAMSP